MNQLNKQPKNSLNILKFEDNPRVLSRVKMRHSNAESFSPKPVKAWLNSASTLEWLGPCASLLCLVHCFGIAVIAILSPGLLKLLPHSEWFEIGILAFSGLAGGFTLFRTGISGLTRPIFVFAFAVGLAGWTLHSHALIHSSLIAMSALQLWTLLKTHSHPKKKPPCCDHS